MNHSIALVTGATSGLGYAAARVVAAAGWRSADDGAAHKGAK
jgi:NAD(P)-dependent dehydrogenase (short-subunit alcohol dehydrogenase family)